MRAILLEIGPILRALRKNRARFLIITLEVALTLAIGVNCANLLIDLRVRMERPSGLDEENLWITTVRPFTDELRDPQVAAARRKDDLRTLETLPGVRAASLIQAIPLSGGGSAFGRKPVDAEGDLVPVPYFMIGPRGIETLGVEIVAGRSFTAEDFGAENHRNILLTESLARLLFPDGDALGKRITDDDGKQVETVVGIVRQMVNSWPNSSFWDHAALLPIEPETIESQYFLVRGEPGAADLAERITGTFAEHPGRLVEVSSMPAVRAETFTFQHITTRLLTAVIALLALVTALGIVGLTSFSVTQRLRHIGTRRALGASRGAIRRHVLVESWLVTSVGLVLGTALAWTLNLALLRWADGVRLDWTLVGLGIPILWTIGLAAAWAPAERAARVAPVEATRHA